MIEKIVEENVWDVLEKTHLPIVVYGMGNVVSPSRQSVK